VFPFLSFGRLVLHHLSPRNFTYWTDGRLRTFYKTKVVHWEALLRVRPAFETASPKPQLGRAFNQCQFCLAIINITTSPWGSKLPFYRFSPQNINNFLIFFIKV
jgi:hypothetical protein